MTQDDRTLLEMAAKAAGMGGGWDDAWGEYVCPTNKSSEAQFWRPLTDDGDALRLAVKLRMHVDCDADGVNVHWWPSPKAMHTESAYEPFGRNADSATRRAIVRAAAAIGEQSK